eukprot:403361005
MIRKQEQVNLKRQSKKKTKKGESSESESQQREEDDDGQKQQMRKKQDQQHQKKSQMYFDDPDDISIDVSSIDIFSLARHGRFQQLKKILEMGVDPNSKDKFGNTVLIIGAQNGNKSIVKLALRFGGHINMTNCQDSNLQLGNQVGEFDDITRLQHSLREYVDMMNTTIHQITVRAGPLVSQDLNNNVNDQMEVNMSNSKLELDRKSHQQIEADFDSEKLGKEIQQQALAIMDTYKRINQEIGTLDQDYNKDEDQLFRELKEIENRNKESIKKYKATKAIAQNVKEQLTKVYDQLI